LLPRSSEIQPCVAPIRPSPKPNLSLSPKHCPRFNGERRLKHLEIFPTLGKIFPSVGKFLHQVTLGRTLVLSKDLACCDFLPWTLSTCVAFLYARNVSGGYSLLVSSWANINKYKKVSRVANYSYTSLCLVLISHFSVRHCLEHRPLWLERWSSSTRVSLLAPAP
jgi:hypothetical protein